MNEVCKKRREKLILIFIMENINPYKLLEVSKDFTLDELKASYKRIAIKVHPDKGGSEYMFNLVTECFKQLMREWKKRNSDKQHYDLKSAYTIQTSATYSEPIRRPTSNYEQECFNIEKFNRIFEENRRETITDKGYRDWYVEDIKEEVPRFKGSSKEAFNNHFEKYVKPTNIAKDIVKYTEPEPLVSTKVQYTELGKGIDDFSGENMSLKRLNFMDLKLAHTTSRIGDPDIIKQRRLYTSIDELKRDRGNIKYTMTPEEEREYIRKQNLEREMEAKREKMIKQQDDEIEQHYNKVHRLLDFMR